MQFLEIIEGRSGEELTSAVLKFLLVNSSMMRDRFVGHLRKQLPASKTPTFRDGIICQCEYPTKDGDIEGSLDLLIREESRMVFGVENKFWANFTDDQPRKYLATLKALVRDDESACRIILLFPKAREKEIHEHVAKQGIRHLCLLIFWEQIQSDLQELAVHERTEVAAAALFLKEYVAKQVLDTEIGISPSQLIGKHVQIGNDFHYDFLYKMKGCLPRAEKIRPATSWIGFAFRLFAENELDDAASFPKQWFGFIRNNMDEVLLGIQTGIANCALRPMDGVECINGLFGGTTFVRIVFDGRLTTTIDWKEWLEPILDGIKAAIVAEKQTVQPTTGPA